MVIGGEEINFYSFYEEGMTSGQVTVPERTGNPVDDAIFERNKFVESRLNVRIANDDDRSGDGLQDDTDSYGLATGLVIYVDPYWASCGVDIIGKNADGEYELIFDSSKLHSTAEKVLHLYYETEDATYIEGDPAAIFAGGKAAMATVRIFSMEGSAMRTMEDSYGVVPMPRLTEDQTTYRSTLHDGFSLVAIPTTVHGDHLEMVCAVLEAMGSASYRIVKPAYYETTLRTKLASDPDSARMMDIITQNLRTDPGYFYVSTFKNFHHGFREIIASKQNTAVSKYASRAKSDKKTVDQVNRRLERLAEKNQR